MPSLLWGTLFAAIHACSLTAQCTCPAGTFPVNPSLVTTTWSVTGTLTNTGTVPGRCPKEGCIDSFHPAKGCKHGIRVDIVLSFPLGANPPAEGGLLVNGGGDGRAAFVSHRRICCRRDGHLLIPIHDDT